MLYLQIVQIEGHFEHSESCKHAVPLRAKNLPIDPVADREGWIADMNKTFGLLDGLRSGVCVLYFSF